MSTKQAWRIGILAMALAVAPALHAQQGQKVLKNDDVVKMVKAGLSESIVVATIQANPGNYDTSTDGVIKLKKNGVTDNEIKAILVAQQGGNGAGAAAPANADAGGASPAPAAAPGPRWQMPSVTVLESGGAEALPLEKTQLAETKTKPTSMASLAGDSAVTQGIQAGVNDATWGAASHMNSAVGGSAVEQAGGIFGGMMARRQPTVTYVWGVPGPASANVLQTTMPKFSVSFANAPGVNANEFAPEIVKLTPAQNTCRLVGATTGKQDVRSHDAADWAVYSSFVEDRVAVTLQKNKAGEYQMSPQAALLPGEYAVVLRPVSKTEKFSGGDVARGQGPGLMFDTLWSFRVSDDAQ
ncbi:MAG TPA: hypothetical protein VGR94_06785 [Candidatus Acidoferrales bacterium]|nr:hypothetical protein [Candidatus Acidoferrales bacterium]HEV2499662.1 hypothetical protein [Terriglobia bacterium]